MIAESGCRLVTVTGAGGVGKTRLAIETAHAMMDDFADGARFVGLAPVAGPDNVPTAIAAALGVDLGSGQPVEAALVRHLARRELLLVIDNFEHVLEAAPLIADLVSATASLTALVTSRAPLHLRAERIFELSPLELPPTDCDDPDELQLAPAVMLFAAAAQARDSGFAVTGTNAHDVNALCRRLDGLPLALELAAGRMRLLSPRDLAVALERSLIALDAGPRDAPPRQRGLHATLEWSHDLMNDAEQAVLAQLAVFAGGASVEAAGAVTVGTLGELESLVEKNLVLAAQGLAGERRIAMLETVRTFAAQKLEERHNAEATRHRHCEYFLDLAERSALEMRRSMSSRAAAPFQADIDNFRAALTWSLSRRQPEMALRLAVALSTYWVAHDWREGARWIAVALALEPDTSPAVRAKALTERAFHLSEPGTFAEAELAARQSLEIHEALGDTAGMSASLTALAWILNAQDRHRDATGPAAAAARCAREVDDPVLLAHALGQQAWAAPTLDETLDLGAEAAAEYRAMGNLFQVSRLQSGLSYDALCHGADEVALRMAEEAQQAAREIRNVRLTVSPRGNEGLAALLLGDIERATEAFRYELAVGHERAIDIVDLYEGITGLAAVCAALGQDELAARLCGAADVAPRQSHCATLQERLDERFFAPARMRSGTEAWQAAYDVGRRVPLSDAVAFALETTAPVAALSRDDRPASPV